VQKDMSLERNLLGPRRRGFGIQTRRDDEATQPYRVVEEEQRRMRPKAPDVPAGWAGNGPPASSSTAPRLVRPESSRVCVLASGTFPAQRGPDRFLSRLLTALRTTASSTTHHQRYQLFFHLRGSPATKVHPPRTTARASLAMAVAYWSKALAVETEKVVQRKRVQMMQAELERYMAHAIGYRPKGRLYATTGHER